MTVNGLELFEDSCDSWNSHFYQLLQTPRHILHRRCTYLHIIFLRLHVQYSVRCYFPYLIYHWSTLHHLPVRLLLLLFTVKTHNSAYTQATSNSLKWNLLNTHSWRSFSSFERYILESAISFLFPILDIQSVCTLFSRYC